MSFASVFLVAGTCQREILSLEWQPASSPGGDIRVARPLHDLSFTALAVIYQAFLLLWEGKGGDFRQSCMWNEARYIFATSQLDV